MLALARFHKGLGLLVLVALIWVVSSFVVQDMKWPLTRGQRELPSASVTDWALRYEQQRPCSAAELSERAAWWPSLHGADPGCRVPACSLFATMGLASGIEAAKASAEAVRVEINQRSACQMLEELSLGQQPE